jgi:hypothetical protein
MAHQEQKQKLPQPEAPAFPVPSDRPVAEAREVWFLPASIRAGVLAPVHQDSATADDAWFAWSQDGQSILVRSKLNGQEVEYPRNQVVVYYDAVPGFEKQLGAYQKAFEEYQMKLVAWRESDGLSYERKKAAEA